MTERRPSMEYGSGGGRIPLTVAAYKALPPERRKVVLELAGYDTSNVRPRTTTRAAGPVSRPLPSASRPGPLSYDLAAATALALRLKGVGNKHKAAR